MLISTRFLDDAKVASLPQGGKLLYLSLLLACGEVTSSSIEASHEVLVRSAGGCGQHVVRLLDQMQSLRLLTWSKNEVFLNRTEEKKRKEEEIKEVKPPDSDAGQLEVKKQPPNTDLNRKIWESYRTAFAARYGVEPVRNAATNSKVAQLGHRLGQDAPDIVSFYLGHNESFYLKKVHDIGLCLKDAESLHTQWKRGQKVTTQDVKRLEKAMGFEQMKKDVEKGGF